VVSAKNLRCDGTVFIKSYFTHTHFNTRMNINHFIGQVHESLREIGKHHAFAFGIDRVTLM
jgi:hypothetical protein